MGESWCSILWRGGVASTWLSTPAAALTRPQTTVLPGTTAAPSKDDSRQVLQLQAILIYLEQASNLVDLRLLKTKTLAHNLYQSPNEGERYHQHSEQLIVLYIFIFLNEGQAQTQSSTLSIVLCRIVGKAVLVK